MAKKLTEYNPDGSIKVAGLVPLFGWQTRTRRLRLRRPSTPHGSDENGHSALASDPRWAQMFQWQKQFVDSIGYDKLQQFASGSAEEFSPSNDFEIGRVAMTLDGEWRVGFIERDKSNVNYGTAPFPVADDQAGSYGSGYIVTNTFTVPTGAQHPYEAWLLAKLLSTDTASLVRLGDQLKNIPDTTEALQSPALTSNPFFSPFLKIYQDPNSSSPPSTPSGADWQGLVDDFAAKWQAGKVPDLNAGLQQGPRTRSISSSRGRLDGVAGVSVGAAARSSRVTSAEANATSRPPPEVGGRARLDVAVDHRVPRGSRRTRWSRACTSRSPTTTCCHLAQWVGLANYRFMAHVSVLLAVVAQHDLDRQSTRSRRRSCSRS